MTSTRKSENDCQCPLQARLQGCNIANTRMEGVLQRPVKKGFNQCIDGEARSERQSLIVFSLSISASNMQVQLCKVRFRGLQRPLII